MSIQRWDVWAIDLGDDDLDIDAGHDEQGEWCKWDEVQAEVARLTAERDREAEACRMAMDRVARLVEANTAFKAEASRYREALLSIANNVEVDCACLDHAQRCYVVAAVALAGEVKP